MNLLPLNIKIEMILDEWDPIGILYEIKPVKYIANAHGEYSIYVEEIIRILETEKDLYSYLKMLFIKLAGFFDENVDFEIRDVCNSIQNIYKELK